MKQQEATISDFTAKNNKLGEENQNLTDSIPQLKDKNNKLMNESQKLRRERDDLSWTLQVILSFNTFPVKDFCPNKSKFFTLSKNLQLFSETSQQLLYKYNINTRLIKTSWHEY